MKKIIKFTAVFILGIIFSCQDKVNVDGITGSYPPTVYTYFPLVSVKQGVFPLKATFVSGVSSPLKSATLTLKDQHGNVIYTVTQSIAGIKDSIVVQGSAFKSDTCALGPHSLDVSVTGSNGKITTNTYPFSVALTEFPANNTQMYISGGFDGWASSQPMTLISAFTWQLKNIDLLGQNFKFKNKTDWSDKNFGDTGGCSGITTVGCNSCDISCGSSGPVIITFNDQTLTFSIKSAVTYKTKLAGLYLLGDFNEFNGSNYKFQLTADDKWELASVRLVPGTQFKFSENSTFKGQNFGGSATTGSGTAVQYGGNITWNGSDGYYKIDFNELSLKYTATLIAPAPPVPTSLIITGDDFGWNNSASPPASQQFTAVAPGVFRITVTLNPTHLDNGNQAKSGYLFIPVAGDWSNKFGGTSKTGGPILYDGDVPGSNTPTPDVAGNYEIDVNFNTNQYTLLKVN